MITSFTSRKSLLLFRIWTAAFLIFVLTLSPVLPSITPLILFGALTSSASSITWTGLGETGYWSDPANWSEGRIPAENDIVVIGTPNPASGEQSESDTANGSIIEIDDDTIVAGIEIAKEFRGLIRILPKRRLTVGREGFTQSGGRFIGSDSLMDVRGSVSLLGGEFNAPAGTLEIEDNLRITGGVFNHNAGTVVFDGFEQIIAGSVTFHNFTKITQLAQTLELSSGTTVTIAGSLKLKGSAPTPGGGPDENLLTIQSSKIESPALIDPRGAIDVSYVRFDNIINTSTKTITCQEYCELSGASGGIEVPGGEEEPDGPLAGVDPRVQGILDTVIPDLTPQDDVPPKSQPGASEAQPRSDAPASTTGAHLIVKKTEAESEASLERGDIISALNTKRILTVHAQNITNPKHQAFNKFGLREPGSLLDVYLQNAKEYKFERTGPSEAKRTNLKTGQETTISDTPNADGEHMDVSRYISRRLQHPTHQIFGAPGQEYWYGGSENPSVEDLDIIWQAIESKTEHRRENLQPPITPAEKRKYEIIEVTDFSDEQAGELTRNIEDSPVNSSESVEASEANQTNEANEAPKKRRFKVDLDAIADRAPGQKLNINDIIQDKTKPSPASLREATEESAEATPETIEASPTPEATPSTSPPPEATPSPTPSVAPTTTPTPEATPSLTPTPEATPAPTIEPSPSPTPLSFLKNLLPQAVHAATKAISWLIGYEAYAATVTTSIGTRAAENVDISSVSGSGPWTVTLGSAPSADTVIGDTLTDEAGTPNSYLITGISGSDLTVRDAFGAGTGPDSSATSQATTTRTNSLIQGWEDDLDDTGVYAASDDAVGEVYNDSVYDESVTIDGGGTVGLNSVTLTVPESERHDGTAGTGARIVKTAATTAVFEIPVGPTEDVSIKWLEVDWNGLRPGANSVFSNRVSEVTIANLLVHSVNNEIAATSYVMIGVSNGTSGAVFNALNNIVYDIDQSENSDGATVTGILASNVPVGRIYNNTIHNLRREDFLGNATGYEYSSNTTVRNNIATDISSLSTARGFLDNGSATESHNASSDSTASGTGSITDIVTADQYVSTTGGSEDLHLKSGSDAIGAGTDLGQTPSGVEFDIDGRDRHTKNDTWDIGADQRAVDFIWDGGGADNNWSTPGNWSDNVVPGSSDLAVFDSTSTKDVTIDTSISVAGIDINSGYDGTITQAASQTITISTNGWVQSAGTFTGGDSAIDINDGSFTLAGGTFTNSSGGMTVERNFTVSGGTYTDSGMVTFDDDASSDNSTVACSGSLGGIVVITKDWLSGGNSNLFTVSSGCSINLGGTPTTVGGISNSGTIIISSGTWTYSAPSATGFTNSGTITHSGDGWDFNHSLTNNNGATITYSGTSLNFQSNLTQSGTFDLSGKTITFDDSATAQHSTVTCSGSLGGTVVITKDGFSGSSNSDFTLVSECSIDLGASPTSIAGDITNSGTITISSGTWTVNRTSGSGITNSGIITHSGDGWDLNASLTNDSGGTITYSGSSITNEASFTQNGTFDLTGKTITFDDTTPGANSWLGCTTAIQGNIIVNQDFVSGSERSDFTLSNNCTVQGNFTRTIGPITNPASAYTLTVQGNVVIDTTDTTGGSNFTLAFGGTADQTFDMNAGDFDGKIDINKSSGKVTLNDNLTMSAETLSITAGTLDHGATSNLTTAAATTIGSSGAWLNTGSGDIALGGNVTNAGYVHLDGGGLGCGDTDDIAITGTATWSNSGTVRIYDVTATNQADSSITARSSTNGGGSSWTINGTCPTGEFFWDGGGGDNNWDTGDNWDVGSAPGSSDTAIFGPYSTKDATIAASINVLGVEMNQGYTGTITQAASQTITVGTSGWTQRAGTFTGGDSAITFPSGDFTQSNGTFTATSGTTTFAGGVDVTISGGTFNHNSGTAAFTATTASIDVNTTWSLNNVTINKVQNHGFRIASGDTVVANGVLTLTDGGIANSGTLNAKNSISVGSGFDGAGTTGGTGTLLIDGAGDQSFTIPSGASLPHVTLNQASTTIDFAAGASAGFGNFALQAGTFTASTGTVTFNGALTLSSGTTFNHNSGTAAFTGTSATVDVQTSLTLNNITVSKGQDHCFQIASGDTIVAVGTTTFSDGGLGVGTLAAQGDVVVNSGFDGDGTACPSAGRLHFTGTNNQTYTDNGGNEPEGDITINKTSGKVTLATATDWDANNQDLTITDGILDLAGNDLTLSSSGTFTNNDTLMLDGDETLTNFTNDADSGRVVYNGTGSYTGLIAGDTYNDLTINNGLVGYWKMDEGADDTCAGGEDVCDSSGNENHGTGTNWDGDEWTTTKPTLNFTNPYALDFDGSDDAVDLNTNFGFGQTSGNPFTFSAWFKTSTTGANQQIIGRSDGTNLLQLHVSSSNNLRVAYGEDPFDQIANSGTVTNDTWHHGVFTFSSSGVGTLYLNGASVGTDGSPTADFTSATELHIGNRGGDDAEEFNGQLDDVRIYDTALNATQVSALYAGGQALQGTGSQTLDANLDVNGDLTLNSGTLDVSGSNYSINVEGAWENNGGTFEAQAGTVEFDGTTGSHEIQSGAQQFANLTVSGSGGTWTLADDLPTDGVLTQSNGTLSTDSSLSYDIYAQNLSQTGGTLTPNTSRITVDSTSSQTLQASSSLYDLDIGDSLKRGLLGHWKMDEGTDNTCSGGQDVCDSSSGGYHGTIGGGDGDEWVQTTAPLNYSNAYALDFDGSDDYVEIGDIPESTVHTLSAWVKTDVTTGTHHTVSYQADRGNFDGGSSMLVPSGVFQFRIYQDGTAETVSSTVNVGDNEWHQIAAVKSGLNWWLYVDGSLANSGTFNNEMEFTDPDRRTSIGRVFDNGSPYPDTAYAFDGLIDDVRIYSRALSATEIAHLGSGGHDILDYTDTDTFTLGASLDVDNDITINSGTLSASTFNITVGNGWSNYEDTSGFSAGTGTVTLDGTDQAVNGSTSFYNLSKTESADDTTDETLTFESGYDPSLVGYWKMDEGADNTCSGGEDVCDTTSYGNHGTGTNWDGDEWVAGAPTLNYTNSYALEFDGSNDEVHISDSSAFAMNYVTLTAWIKTTSSGSTRHIVSRDSNNHRQWQFRKGPSNTLSALFWNTSSTLGSATSSATINSDDWTHVTATWDGTTIRTYINGSPDGTGSLTGTLQTGDDDIVIGDWERSVDQENWDGQIDDVRIYNRALSASEVARLANGDMTAINTTTVANTLTLDGRDTDDRINLVSSTAGIQHTLDVTSGDQTVDFLDVSDSASDSNDIICQSCVDGSNNDDATATPHWIFQAAANIVIQGIAYADKAVTALTGGRTVSVAVNGSDVASTETNATTGAYSLDSIPASASDIITVYLEDETEDAVTVTESDANDMTGVDLYQDYLITRHDNSDALTNTDLSTGAVGSEDDISNIYSITTGNLTTASGKSLYVPASHTFTPGGNVDTSSTGGFGMDGTFNQGSGNTLTVGSGGYTQDSGTFNGGDSAITNSGAFTLSGGTFTSTSGTLTFNSFIGGGGGRTFSFEGGTFEHNNGTINLAGGESNTLNFDTSETFNNVTVNTSSNPSNWVVTSGDTMIVDGTLTLTNGNINTGTVDANGTISVGAGFDGGSGTLLVNGAGDQSFSIPSGASMMGINLSSAATTITADAGSVAIDGSFTQSSGVVAINSSSFAISQAFTLSGGTFTSSPGTLTFNSSLGGGQGRTMSFEGGTFNHNSGTVAFAGGEFNVVNVDSGAIFNSVSFTSSCDACAWTISSGDTVIATGSTTLTNGQLRTGTLSAQGDVTVDSTFDGGTALLHFTGTNDQTYTDNGGAETTGDITINKSSGSRVTLASATDWDGTNQDLTITDGILDLAGNDLTLSSSGTFTNNDTLMLDGDETLTNFTNDTDSGQVVYNGTGSYTGLAAGDTYNDLTINNGLVGYWKFDEGADDTCAGGEDVCDSSGNENHGTGTNWDGDEWVGSTGPTLNFTNPDHLDFDGSNDYVNIPNDSALQPSFPFTFSAWINADALDGTNGNAIFQNDDQSSTYRGFWTIVDINGNFTAHTGDNTGATTNDRRSITGTSTLSTGQWYHVVAVMAGQSNMTLYVNGTDEGGTLSGNGGDIAYSTGDTRIGHGEISAVNYTEWNGKMDDVRIYDTALTPTQVSALYSGGQALQGTGSQTLDANLDVNGDLTLNSGTLDVSGSNYSINVEGAWENNGGTFEAQAGTVEFDGTTGSHELQSGGQNFYDLDFATSGGTWTLNDRLEVDNTYTQSSAIVDTSSNNYPLVVADWDQTAGTFTDNSSTLTLNSSSNQTVNFDDPVYDLQVEDPTESGLVGYWKFDEGQGTTAYDSSGNSNTGTLTNNPKWSEDVNGTTTYENPYSLEFDGSDDYVDVANENNFDFSGDFAISAWIKTDQTSRGSVVYKGSGSGNWQYGIDTSLSANRATFTVYQSTGDSGYLAATGSTTINDNGWHHLVGTISGNVATIHVNGSQDGIDNTTTGTRATSGTASVRVGARGDAANRFDGLIDDVRIYNTALDSAEISRLANGKYADGDNSVATYTLNTSLDVDNDLYLQSGILAAGANNSTVANNWNNYAGDSALTAGTGTVTLDGTDQAINGSTSFYNLSKTESADDTTDETLTFESGYDPSLVGYWKMDEGADNTCSGGEDVCDTTSNGNHGTIQNGDADEWVAGAPTLNYTNSFAMDFDGDNDLVLFSDLSTHSSRTQSVWFRLTSAPGSRRTVSSIGIGNGGDRWYITVNGTDLDIGFGNNLSQTFSSVLTVGTWHNATMVATNNLAAATVYLDGQSLGSTTGTNWSGGGLSPRIGGGLFGTFPGQIDDLRTYNRALSATEVARLANGDMTAINTTTVSNTLTLDGRDADDRINLVSSTAGIQHTLDVTSGDQTVDFLDVSDSASDSNDIICQSCVDGSNNDDATATPHWIFQAAANIVIQGIAYADKAVTALTGGRTVSVAVNGSDVASTETNATTGEYSLDSIPASASDIITVYLEDETEDAVTVTESDANDMTGVDLYQDYLIVRNDNAGEAITSDLSTGAVADDDVSNVYSVSAGDLTIVSGKNLHINSAVTFDLEANSLELNSGTFSNDGTLQLQSNSVLSNFTNDNDSGTLEYLGDGDGAATTHSLFSGDATADYYNLVINDTSASNSDTFGTAGTLKVAGDMTVTDGTYQTAKDATGDVTTTGTLLVDTDGTFIVRRSSTSGEGAGQTITAATMTISGNMNADGEGFDVGAGPGTGVATDGGGSHGGRGGYSDADVIGSATYGSFTNPISLGSGPHDGNSGGGAITLVVSGTATISGTLSVDGDDNSISEQGGGAGGSLNITASTLTGSGTIRANGGDGLGGGGGGGGRIGLDGVTTDTFDGTLQVSGGSPRKARAGTIYFNSAKRSSLTIGGAGNLTSLTLGSDDSNNYTFGTLTIQSGGTLTIDGNPSLNSNNGGAATLNITTLDVQSGGTLTADNLGFQGENGPGKGVGNDEGGGYGGLGGAADDSSIANTTYGSITAPTMLGSGADDNVDGGHGGGALILNVSGDTTVDGTVSSNGQDVSGERGAGAGGSVYLTTDTISGAGTIQANGGVKSDTNGASSGGGGRVAVILTSGTSFGSVTTTAYGGDGATANRDGAAGTVYLEDANDGSDNGELIIDNNNVSTAAGTDTLISSSVTDTDVGTVTIQNAGKLQMDASTTLTVTGDWTNNGTATLTGGEVILDGTNQTLSGTGATTFYNLTKTEGANDSTDEILTFEAGDTFTVSNFLNFQGRDDDDRINILSDSPASQFTLDVTSGQQVEYWLDVTDSAVDSFNIACQNCINGGGNDDADPVPHWIFGNNNRGRLRIIQID